MVTLEQIRSSNSQIAKALPPGLVAVFAGATSGIGESSLKQFAKHAVKPRIYFLGRSKESGDRIRTELQQLNPEGEYIYISVDVSKLRAVDEVCRDIKAKEKAINILFLSTGTALAWKETEEGLHYPIAVAIFARLRFIVNLLPLLQNATHLRRVVSVAAGTFEGPVFTDDLQFRRRSMFSWNGRGHFASVMTLALEAVAQKAPTVSFIHDYPGFVKTNLGHDVPGVMFAIFRGVFAVITLILGPFLVTPFDECGERQLFHVTSARFPSRVGDNAAGVALPKGVSVARGTDGQDGSGMYSINNQAESASPKVEAHLRQMREDGTAQKVWDYVEEEFVRITGAAAALT